MKISKEFLQQRLNELRAQEQEHRSNLIATNGAIQFCEQLLSIVESEQSLAALIPMPSPEKADQSPSA